MTAYDLRKWSAGHPRASSIKPAPVSVVSQTVDFSKRNATTSDTIKVLDIPAGSFVLGIHAKVLTAEGATLTVDIGDSGGAAVYGDNVDLNTTTDSFSFNATTTPTNGVGKFYAAADYIVLLVNNSGADTAVVQFDVAYIELFTGF